MLIAEQGEVQGSAFEVFKAFPDTLRDTRIEDDICLSYAYSFKAQSDWWTVYGRLN